MSDKLYGDAKCVIKNVGKGSKREELPSRYSMSTVAKGDPMDRYMNNYSKKPRSPSTSPSIVLMGRSW